MLSHKFLFLCARSIKNGNDSRSAGESGRRTQSSPHRQTRVVLGNYLNMDVITCNELQYTVTLKTATTYRFVKLHL